MEDAMSLRINTNVPAIAAGHRLELTKESLDHVQEKLASGTRITKAMDDASGLAISDRLNSAGRSTRRNIAEASNGLFLLQTADGALNYMTDMVIRMKELTIAAASDTNGDKERFHLNNEVQALKSELDRLSNATQFNGRPLLNGEGGEVSIQVGPTNRDSVDRITLATNLHIDTDTLGISGVDLSQTDGARAAIDPLDTSLDIIAKARGEIGASESALHSTINNLMQYEETVTGAYSQIRDADLAVETTEQAKYNILTQAGVAVLAQANNSPAVALKLLSS